MEKKINFIWYFFLEKEKENAFLGIQQKFYVLLKIKYPQTRHAHLAQTSNNFDP